MSDIRKNREKIGKFGQDATEMGMKKKAKTMKLGADKNVKEALYVWFKQKRLEEVPISGLMLQEIFFSKPVTCGNGDFASAMECISCQCRAKSCPVT